MKQAAPLFAALSRDRRQRVDQSCTSDDGGQTASCTNPQHLAAKQQRPSGVWLPRRQRLLVRPRISYVYLMVHRSENRFKVGKSISPKDRLSGKRPTSTALWS